MKECHWRRIKRTLKYTSDISPVILRDQLSKSEMKKLLSSGQIYGFALVDIKDTPSAKKFLDLNFPPILKKIDINHEDLPIWMRQNVSEREFPRTTIVQAMHGEKLLLHTKLIQFYVENGFQVLDVHHVFEYQGSACFKTVHDTVYKARVEATATENHEGDQRKATAVKLTSNAMYGQMLMVCIKSV